MKQGRQVGPKSHTYPFHQMVDVIPEGEVDGARITHFEVNEDEAKRFNLSCYFTPGGARQAIDPGRYVRLHLDEEREPMMSDTPFEQSSNRYFVLDASGDVLIGGLGIGMVVHSLLHRHELEKPKYSTRILDPVRSITVVEIDHRVIELVEPYVRDDRLTVIQGDVFEWKPLNGMKYDSLWFDIWPHVCVDNLPEIARLHQRGKYWKRSKDALMDSWEVDVLRSMRKGGW